MIDEREKAWRAYLAGYMKMLSRQALPNVNGKPVTIAFEDLNEKGQAEVKADFDEWWESESAPSAKARKEPLTRTRAGDDR